MTDPILSDKLARFYGTGSAIRRMFEEGLRLRKLHGAEAVADLSIGNPTFPPPPAFVEAFRRVAARAEDTRGTHSYMSNAGYADVRAAVAANLRRRGLLPDVQAEHLVMTSGAAGALNVALKAILEPGDEVVVPRPYFFEYQYYADNHGGRIVLVDTRADHSLDVGAIAAAINPRTRAVLLNSPNNPSGRMYDRASLEALADVLEAKSAEIGRPVLLISDEPYREVVFEGAFVSPAAVYRNSFQCYSWSKAFSISGERIGYVAANPRMAVADWGRTMGALALANRILGFVNAAAFIQRVIGEAVDAEVDVAHYAEKRARLCQALDAGGYDYVRPEGTFYLFPRTPEPEADFIARATEHLLLVVPGSAFDVPGHFRISFAADDRTVDLACEKLLALAPVAA